MLATVSDAAIVAQLAGARRIARLSHARQRTEGVVGVVWRAGAAVAICAHRCELAALPDAIGALDVRGNQLDDVPEALRALPLTKLDLRWNPLRDRPAWLDELTNRGCRVYQ